LSARILGVATELPGHRFDQARASRFMETWYGRNGGNGGGKSVARTGGGEPELDLPKVLRILRNSGVETRHSVVPIEILMDPAPLDVKNRLYIENAQVLGECAVASVLEKTGIEPKEIDLFITTSCTGFMIPALDARILNRLGFRSDVKRLPITELGCAAGAASIRIANDYIRAWPGSTVLCLAVELATLTFQPNDRSADHLVSCAIFGDGAAAMILSDRPGAGLRVDDAGTRFFPGTESFMGYDLRETGFHIFLSPEIPGFIRGTLMPAVTELLEEGHRHVDRWLVHPGGPKILDAIEDAVSLPRGGLAESRAVLRRVGNLSSATIYFILDEYLRNSTPRPGERQAVLAVGPGFGMDYAFLEWSER
jgi:alkylresorcinol/alkylpyrone synthase